MTDADVLAFVIPLFQKLAEDDQDSVRLLTVEILVALANRISKEQSKQLLLTSFIELSNDKAWRVRYMVASKYVEVRLDIFFCVCAPDTWLFINFSLAR